MSQTEASILIIDDDPDVLTTARMFLKQLFSNVITEEDPGNIPSHMQEQSFDIILLDMNFSKGRNDGSEGIFWLNSIIETDPSTVVLFITAYGGIDLAVESIKAGAFDFIVKPWKNDKLLSVIHAALQLSWSRKDLEKFRMRQQILAKDLDQSFGEIIGNSFAMNKVHELVGKVAGTDANVLLLGENGTGKELIAREIHRKSMRELEAFINVDLGAIHENLFESELFGHTKGAFTDAREDKPGRLEIASGGTLFLDEIGNLSLPLQAKLLSVLETRKLTMVGSNKPKDIDFRLVCATNLPVYQMVQKKEFREDLLYRINTVEIRIPPLRERTGDIPLLIDFFLAVYSKKYKKHTLRLTSGTKSRLEKYAWPGNVRELQHAVERAVILSEDNLLHFGDFSADLSYQSDENREDILNLQEMEKRNILKAISRNKGNMTRAAEDLGIARTALYRRLHKYGL